MAKRKLLSAISVALISAVFTSRSVAFAAEQFEYPELLVTPRASERVEREAAKEPSRMWTTHAPIQVSALTTLVTGAVLRGNTNVGSDSDKRASLVGIAVGGGWLAATTILAFNYEPYRSTAHDLKTMPKGTPREQLLRERYAEEEIHDAARLGARLSWLSTATNLGASIYMIAKAENGTVSKPMGFASALVSFAPLLFRYHWQQVSDEQESYKKRIYAPIASASLFQEPGTDRVVPGVALALQF